MQKETVKNQNYLSIQLTR